MPMRNSSPVALRFQTVEMSCLAGGTRVRAPMGQSSTQQPQNQHSSA